MNDFLKPGEVAQILNITIRTVWVWAKKGRLESVIINNGHRKTRRYPISNVLSLLNDENQFPLRRKPGVYCITNKINKKVYIGSSLDLDDRKQHHFSLLSTGNHPNVHLQNAINKYGIDRFEFLVLVECPETELLRLESYYIKTFCACDREKGYNIKPNPERRYHAEETKKKISQSLMGHQVSENTREKQSKAKMGKQTRLGQKHSAETKEKIKKKLKGRKLGPRSEEVKEKIRIANIGKKRTEEARNNMRLARYKFLSKLKGQQ
jgi:group I intron endonuclease